MQIKDLPASSALNADDVLAKDTNGVATEKITGADLAAGVKTLGGLVNNNEMNSVVGAVASDIAIIIEGNQTTHTGGVAVGEYVIVRNSTISGITDGLYKATQAIPANTVVTSAYLAAVDGGGLNAVLKPSDVVNNLTNGDTNPVNSIAVLAGLAFANRVDCSVSMETFAETVPSGTFQYFRMRNGEPSSSWNYSPGFVFAPSSTEKIVVMFNREGDAIAMKAKYGNSWSNWKMVSLS